MAGGGVVVGLSMLFAGYEERSDSVHPGTLCGSLVVVIFFRTDIQLARRETRWIYLEGRDRGTDSPGGTAVARWTLRHLVAWTLGIAVIGEPMGTVKATGPSEPQTVVPLSDGFEDENYRFTARCAQKCTSTWERITPGARSGTYAFHGADVATASDSSLLPNDSLIIPVNASAATLTFWHRFDFEQTDNANFFDGGLLEVSSDNGATWVDAGSNITAGRYNGTIIPTQTGNALAGREAWVGTQVAEWQQVSGNLFPYRGEPFTFRLRLGTDSSNLGIFPGWFVD